MSYDDLSIKNSDFPFGKWREGISWGLKFCHYQNHEVVAFGLGLGGSGHIQVGGVNINLMQPGKWKCPVWVLVHLLTGNPKYRYEAIHTPDPKKFLRRTCQREKTQTPHMLTLWCTQQNEIKPFVDYLSIKKIVILCCYLGLQVA